MHSHFNILYQDVFSWIEAANDTGVPEEADAHDEEGGEETFNYCLAIRSSCLALLHKYTAKQCAD